MAKSVTPLGRVLIKRLIVAGAMASSLVVNLATAASLAPDALSAELRYQAAVETDGGRHSMSRFTLTPQATWRFSPAWRAEASVRLEVADDATGLGSTAGYSSLSKPWVDNNRVRLELDRANLSFRSGATRVRLGKQVTAWGVLDGVRITDRFDAVRRRDFIYTDVRPERIARWGLQARTDIGAWTVEVASAIDPTVSQQANLQDAFAPQAKRFTGGVDLAGLAGTESLPIRTSGRNAYGRDLTYGFRSSRDLGAGRLSLLAFRGPTTDPVLEWAAGTSGNVPGNEIELRHPLRTLVGASFDYTLGGAVLRAELAYVPDQPVNVDSGIALQTTTEERWLAGIGIDLDAPFGIFVNAQLALDYMTESGDRDSLTERVSLARPQTDLISTVRAQKSFPQAGWKLQVEWLGSLTDGDGVVRPQIGRELNDKLSLSLGGDFAVGDREGFFGQYEARNRAWLSLQLTL